MSQQSAECHTLLVLGYNLTMKHGFLFEFIQDISLNNFLIVKILKYLYISTPEI
jgi:hypothetical protein